MCAAPAAAKHLIEMERLAVWIAFNLLLHCIKSNKCEIIEDDNFRPKYFITIFSTTVTYSVDNCNIARRPKLTYYWMLFVNCSWQTFWDGTAQLFMRSRSSVTWTRMRITVTRIVNTETALSAFCSPRLQTNWTELYKCCRATFYGSPAKGGGRGRLESENGGQLEQLARALMGAFVFLFCILYFIFVLLKH